MNGGEPDSEEERGWGTAAATLGVGELRRLLNRRLGRGRVVFVMTQCHAGGFHYLSIPRAMSPNPKWFDVLPDWAEPGEDAVFPRVAGFTAADEYSPAAGCDPAPTVEGWAGYERFIPEQLFGLDLFTLERVAAPLESFAQAHQTATLVDRTIDNPYSTSEQYLERWADLIEQRLSEEPNLTPSMQRQVEAYHAAVDGVVPAVWNRAFRQRRLLFRRFTGALIEQNPSLNGLLLSGAREELEAAIEGDDTESEELREEPARERRRGRRRGTETRALWNETLRPAWTKAVRAGQVDHIAELAIEFENHLLREEADGGDYFSGRRGAALTEEVFWYSGHGDPQNLDPARAEAIALWAAERRSKILEWARDVENASVRAAAERLAQRAPARRPSSSAQSSQLQPVSRETAAVRVLFYRRVLAAWRFLLAVKERPALGRLHEIIELEQTPLPPSRSIQD